MRALVTPGLVNGVFDVGDVSRLPPKRILRLSDVFVSHAHMDHFAGPPAVTDERRILSLSCLV